MPRSKKRMAYLKHAPTISAYILAIVCLALIVFGSANASNKEIPDHRINAAVASHLLLNRSVSDHLIDVTTTDGVVTLTGSVDNLLAKERAVQVARSIRGVRSVIDKLIVIAPPRSDEELKKDVREALLSDPATDLYEIKAKVADGTVTLSGNVQSWAEKNLCEDVVKGVRGIRQINNKIAVTYTESRKDKEIEIDVEERLRTDVRVNADLIDVSVKDGQVKLSGVVGSVAEYQRAISDAWISGVKSVKADLDVEWWARDRMRRSRAHLFITDEEVEKAVKDALLHDPRVLSFKPTVWVDNGTVTLTGSVENLAAKRAAGQTARNTIGVWRVLNLLKVRPDERVPDNVLTGRVTSALKRDPFVERHEITVSSLNNRVFLYGEVDSGFEKSQAREVASKVAGVIAVENYIDIRPIDRKADFRIKQDIKDQLFWSPYVDADEVFVTVDEGTATLTGTVDTFYELRMATKNAVDGGAQDVINKLTVRFEKTPTWF